MTPAPKVNMEQEKSIDAHRRALQSATAFFHKNNAKDPRNSEREDSSAAKITASGLFLDSLKQDGIEPDPQSFRSAIDGTFRDTIQAHLETEVLAHHFMKSVEEPPRGTGFSKLMHIPVALPSNPSW